MTLPPPKELAAFAETQARHCALNDMVEAYGQQCADAALDVVFNRLKKMDENCNGMHNYYRHAALEIMKELEK